MNLSKLTWRQSSYIHNLLKKRRDHIENQMPFVMGQDTAYAKLEYQFLKEEYDNITKILNDSLTKRSKYAIVNVVSDWFKWLR